jgi:hypothetical protein
VHPVTFPALTDAREWHLSAPDEACCRLTVFAFFPWLPLVAPACVFGRVFAAVILFGRKVACCG